MGKIDKVKEELNYLKVWLGIIVVTTIGLIGWLANHYDTASVLKTGGDVVAIVLLTFAIIFIDRNEFRGQELNPKRFIYCSTQGAEQNEQQKAKSENLGIGLESNLLQD